MDFGNIILLAGLFLSTIMAIAVGLMGQRNNANIWLAGFLVTSALVFFVKYLYATGEIVNQPHWFKVNIPFGLLRPLFFYMYGYFLLNNFKRFKPINLLHFIPFLLLTIYLGPFFIQDTDYKRSVLTREITNTLGVLPSWYVLFQLVYSLFYLILLYLVFRKFIREHPRPNRTQQSIINWIWFVGIGGAIFIALAILLRFSGFSGNYNFHLYELFSILLICFCIRLLMLPRVIDTNPKISTKYLNSGLSKNEAMAYFKQIDQLMMKEQLYKNSKLKLADLAGRLNIPEYLISKIINESFGHSFREYVNIFRVEEAKKKLLKSHDKFTIEGIAHDAGFHSRASFYTAFKKHTNLTPSEYLELYH